MRKDPPLKFAIREADGTWSPCDSKLNKQLRMALHDMAGTPDTITLRDEYGDPHVLSWPARIVLDLALRAMDARLRPGGCYREKADEIYTILASGPFHEDGLQELRRVFQLGAKRPWLVPDDSQKKGGEP